MIEVIATVTGFVVTIGAVGVAAGKLSAKQDALSDDVAELKKKLDNGISEKLSHTVARVDEHHFKMQHVEKKLDRLPCVACER